GPGEEDDRSRCVAPLACGRARFRVLHRKPVSRRISPWPFPGLSRLLEPLKTRGTIRGLHSLPQWETFRADAGISDGVDAFARQVRSLGRPVGLLVLPDGSLLVSDDGGNKIWRISYKG